MRKNFAIAWPLAVNALLIQSMLMIDTLLVAPLGELPIAAMGIATTILAFVLGVEIAIGNGIQLIVGRAHGSNNQADLAIAYWAGLFITISVALFFLVILMFFRADLIAVFTTDSELARLTESYLAITQYIVVIAAYTQVCMAFCNGRGNSSVPLKGFLIELPVNALLSYVLIHGIGEHSGLGVAGAAWGSLVAVMLRAIFFYIALQRASEVDFSYPPQRQFRQELSPQYKEIYPVAANFLILSVGATIYQLLYAKLDLFSFAAITLIFPWVRAGTQFTNAWAQASAISISQALGQKNLLNLRSFIGQCTHVAMLISACMALLFLLLSQSIGYIYPNVDPVTQMALAIIAPLYIILPIIRAYNTVAGNVMRALGDSKTVLKIHFVTQWLMAIPLCALLILYFEVSIFWAFAMLPIEELFKTIPFYRYKKRNLQQLSNGD